MQSSMTDMIEAWPNYIENDTKKSTVKRTTSEKQECMFLVSPRILDEYSLVSKRKGKETRSRFQLNKRGLLKITRK